MPTPNIVHAAENRRRLAQTPLEDIAATIIIVPGNPAKTEAGTASAATVPAVPSSEEAAKEEPPTQLYDLSNAPLPFPIPVPTRANPNPRVEFWKLQSFCEKAIRARAAAREEAAKNAAGAALSASNASNASTTPVENSTTTTNAPLPTPIRPARSAICPLVATAPPPTCSAAAAAARRLSRRRRSETWNGVVPAVYGGGRSTAWVAVEKKPKIELTAAQKSLMALTEVGKKSISAVKQRGDEKEDDGSSTKESELQSENAEEAKCECLMGEKEGLAGVKCGRRCELMYVRGVWLVLLFCSCRS